MGISSEIVLYEKRGAYYPNETINGHVNYTLAASKKILGVSVRFKGVASTSWIYPRITKGKIFPKFSITNSGIEKYFEARNYIFGGDSGEIEMAPGTYTYSFSFKLPESIPSSFEGPLGYVRYSLTTKMERELEVDHETKREFTVLAPLDLNTIPHLKDPVHLYLEKNFCCACCKSGKAKLNVKFPMTGFWPGQVVPFDIDVENESDSYIVCIYIYLKKITTFHCQKPKAKTNSSREIVSQVKTGEIKMHSSEHFNVDLNIPSTPPSDLIYCNIIDVKYVIEATYGLGTHLNKSVQSPVTVGTVPLNMNNQLPAILLTQNINTQLSNNPTQYYPNMMFNPSLPYPPSTLTPSISNEELHKNYPSPSAPMIDFEDKSKTNKGEKSELVTYGFK